MHISAFGPRSCSFFHFDVIPIFDISLMVEACLFCELKLFMLACLRDMVGVFNVTEVVSFMVGSCVLRV
jgi:hypothetical protein